MAILIVDDLSPEALKYLKEKGIVIGFIRELFGERYAESLKQLTTILNNAGASLVKNPNAYLDLINELSVYNRGLLNNIRGTLFEFVVGHIHSVKKPSINLGREIIDEKGRHEMDMIAIYDDKVVIAEAKAYKAPIPLEMVEKWITDDIPAFRKYLLKDDFIKDLPVEFEYWSVSGFEDDALDYLKKRIAMTGKYAIRYLTKTEIIEKAKSIPNKKLKEALQNYFFKTVV